jgi:hypothetical protein
MWQYQSPPQERGEVRSYKARGNIRAHLGRDTRSEVIGHMAASEPTLTWRRGPGRQRDTTGAHPSGLTWSRDARYVAACECMFYSLS